MAANCQACVVKVGTLHTPVGNLGEPFGACRNCSAFACGHHGHRDFHVPEFMCVECDPRLLSASAAAITPGARQGGGPQVQAMLAGYHLSALPPERWAITSLAEFQRRRPRYNPSLLESASRAPWSPQWMGPEFREPPNPMRELLVLAGLITKRLQIPRDQVPEFLQPIWASVE
jgi:hypothetical protein